MKVTEEGKVEPMYQQFGTQGTVLNFNPVWDDDDGGTYLKKQCNHKRLVFKILPILILIQRRY